MLTATYVLAGCAKTQAASDFLIFGMVALSSFSSGALLNDFGWKAVNLFILPFAAAILVVLLLYRRWHGAMLRRVTVRPRERSLARRLSRPRQRRDSAVASTALFWHLRARFSFA